MNIELIKALDRTGEKSRIYHKLLVLKYFHENKGRWKTARQVEEYFLLYCPNNVLIQASSATKLNSALQPQVSRVLQYFLNELKAGQFIVVPEEGDKNKYKYNHHRPDNLKHFVEFDEEQITELLRWKLIFEKYAYLPFFGDLNHFIKGYDKKLQEQMEEEGTEPSSGESAKIFQIAALESNPRFSDPKADHDLLFTLYVSIERCEAVTFEYRRFATASQEARTKEYIDFRPYLLKEHERRWYLIGKEKDQSRIIRFACDRIVKKSLDKQKGEEFEREQFDPKALWKHSMGIYTDWEDDQGKKHETPIEISFKLKDGKRWFNIDYVKTLPLHRSQNSNWKKDKSEYVTITLNMFPDSDLIRKIRSFGSHNVVDIQPDYLSRWVNEC
jgi:hypothetical protein